MAGLHAGEQGHAAGCMRLARSVQLVKLHPRQGLEAACQLRRVQQPYLRMETRMEMFQMVLGWLSYYNSDSCIILDCVNVLGYKN